MAASFERANNFSIHNSTFTHVAGSQHNYNFQGNSDFETIAQVTGANTGSNSLLPRQQDATPAVESSNTQRLEDAPDAPGRRRPNGRQRQSRTSTMNTNGSPSPLPARPITNDSRRSTLESQVAPNRQDSQDVFSPTGPSTPRVPFVHPGPPPPLPVAPNPQQLQLLQKLGEAPPTESPASPTLKSPSPQNSPASMLSPPLRDASLPTTGTTQVYSLCTPKSTESQCPARPATPGRFNTLPTPPPSRSSAETPPPPPPVPPRPPSLAFAGSYPSSPPSENSTSDTPNSIRTSPSAAPPSLPNLTSPTAPEELATARHSPPRAPWESTPGSAYASNVPLPMSPLSPTTSRRSDSLASNGIGTPLFAGGRPLPQGRAWLDDEQRMAQTPLRNIQEDAPRPCPPPPTPHPYPYAHAQPQYHHHTPPSRAHTTPTPTSTPSYLHSPPSTPYAHPAPINQDMYAQHIQSHSSIRRESYGMLWGSNSGPPVAHTPAPAPAPGLASTPPMPMSPPTQFPRPNDLSPSYALGPQAPTFDAWVPQFGGQSGPNMNGGPPGPGYSHPEARPPPQHQQQQWASQAGRVLMSDPFYYQTY
ncbi:hypothetical protein D9756_010648 [Leucocoprinus leucothites]|uniref:Uncharacterized protein n=1 Tax=Leucocoprinus leucothites TaxID=201217 RepID=A0A8H5FT09_9AGAR|nr:hypothetical protein D9756_010648 [Leucoagaricus leucothites]